MERTMNDTVDDYRVAIESQDQSTLDQLLPYYDRIWSNVSRESAQLASEIEAAKESGEDVNPNWLTRQQRYQQIMRDADSAKRRFSQTAEPALTGHRQTAVENGYGMVEQIIARVGMDTLGGINVPRTDALIGALNQQNPLQSSLDSYGERNKRIIRDELIDSLAVGKSPRVAQRRIEDKITGNYSKARLEALVRTESSRASRLAMNQYYQRMAERGLLAGLRWVAAKSARTCAACLAMDGVVVPVEQAAYHFHVSCRCIWSPVPIDSDFEYETGEEWLRRQGPDVQEQILGRRGAQLFDFGDLSLMDFVGFRRDSRWGDSIQALNPRAAMLAAGQPRNFTPGIDPNRRTLVFQGFETTMAPEQVPGRLAPAIALPEAEAKRWADEQPGTTMDLYHATTTEVAGKIEETGFRPSTSEGGTDLGVGVYFSKSPTQGEFYEGIYYPQDGAVVKAYSSPQRLMSEEDMLRFVEERGLEPPINSPEAAARFTEEATAAGWDGVQRKVYDAEDVGLDEDVWEVVIFNPSSIVVVKDG